MLTRSTAPAIFMLLASCVAAESGVRDPVRFRAIAERVDVESTLDWRDFADCFERRGVFLPEGDFLAAAEGEGVDYRLRGFGFTFEEAEFRPRPDGGSRAIVLLAPGVNDKWRRDFERDRMQPLRQCASDS